MGKIFCLMGKSSTGKDTIFHKVMESDQVKLERIIPYTTRPIRVGETNGVEYFFVNDTDVTKMESEGKIVELRSYNTVHGIWKYMTVDDGNIDYQNHDYFIIGTLESYEKYLSYFTKDVLVPILITVDDGIRLKRALEREMSQEQPKYKELCRRFLADEEDFSEVKIEKLGIEKRFYNNNLEECVKEVIDYIKSFR